MNPVIERLRRLEPKPVQAIPLMWQLGRDGLPASVDELLALAPEIEAAQAEIDRISTQSARIVELCLKLSPVPSPKTPTGF